MYGLRLTDGDLQIVGGSYQLCDGATKTQQDVGLALGEPLGNDRFHPGWGSQLFDYIGLILDQATLFEIEQEVARVIANYTQVQYDQIQADALTQSASRFTTAEIIGEVTGIDVSAALDTVTVGISITTADEQDLVLTASVGGNA